MFVVDAPGHILERLALGWVQWGRGVSNFDILSGRLEHPYAIRRAGVETGMLHWVVTYLFARSPAVAWVPQTVMVHHVSPATSNLILGALPYADAIATSSKRWQLGLSQLTGRDVFYVPYTLDTSLFRPTDRAAAREPLHIDPDRYVIGFSAKARSNIDQRKAPDLFARIAEEAAARWNDVTVLIVGKGWNELVARLRARGVDVRHLVPDTTAQTAAFYPAMNVFLCTSTEEGGPCTILEAMACEIPVISTDVGHVPEVIQHGESGFIVRERRVSAFLDRMAELRSSGARSRQIAWSAREWIVREREDSSIIPRIDFETIHASARLHFSKRSLPERAARILPRARLAARYAARQILREKKSGAP